MKLAALAARRLVLRRGLGALLGGALLGGARERAPEEAYEVAGGGFRRGGRVVGSAVVDEAREAVARPLVERGRALRKVRRQRTEAWHDQDMDLVTLGSTSRAWRASVMIDRIRARDTLAETLNDRIDALWSAPAERLEELVRSWIDG